MECQLSSLFAIIKRHWELFGYKLSKHSFKQILRQFNKLSRWKDNIFSKQKNQLLNKLKSRYRIKHYQLILRKINKVSVAPKQLKISIKNSKYSQIKQGLRSIFMTIREIERYANSVIKDAIIVNFRRYLIRDLTIFLQISIIKLNLKSTLETFFQFNTIMKINMQAEIHQLMTAYQFFHSPNNLMNRTHIIARSVIRWDQH